MGSRRQQLETRSSGLFRGMHPDKPRGEWERYAKRAINRAERREAKKDPEAAPKRRKFHGYTW